MTQKKYGYEELFIRHPGNPILTAENWPYPCNSVFNPAATLMPDGSTLLLCRVEDLRGHSHFTVARSQNGIDQWEIEPEPTMVPEPDRYPEEIWGIEDPRITFVPELNRYAIIYTSYSRGGPGVSLAMTQDFRNFERYGVIMPPDDKDAALLPHRINGKWALVHRPVGTIGAHMWLSYSNDLIHWGEHRLMLEARRGAWWDANKLGLCNPPIETSEGWLVVYHGVRQPCSGCLYRLGLALFDLDNPEICIRRSEEWVVAPEEQYERFGDVGNVVFPCGHTVTDDGETLRLYYGAADTVIGLMTARIPDLLTYLARYGRAYAPRQSQDQIPPSDGPYLDHDRRL